MGPAQALAAAARADEESYRKQVDVVTMATFESGNLDQLDALLAARSPQDFLDQMSALETISSEYRTVLTTLITKVGEADRAQADAAAAVARAQAAVAEAAQAEQQLGDRKRDADARIATAEHLLRALSPASAASATGPPCPRPRSAARASAWPPCAPPPASWASRTGGARRARAATTAPGSPRGRSPGPVSRFRGRAASRRSSARRSRGTRCSPATSSSTTHPVSHVGIYAGDGKFINAPQSGDVVRYQNVSRSAFSGARRL